jgi:succinate dehydrogenase flavin-adding protein (antitoxin of CptAB toxin-antitoxin module)
MFLDEVIRGVIVNDPETVKGNDPIVEAVRQKLKQRSDVGIKKYGKTLERSDYDLIDWLKEAQQEAMDMSLYCEAAMRKIVEDKNNLIKTQNDSIDLGVKSGNLEVTSVEWLINELNKVGFNLEKIDLNVFEQAKLRAELDIVVSYNDGCIDTLRDEMKVGSNYYTEKYGRV